MDELDARRDIDRIDIDLQQRHVADPGFVFDLDGVVAEPDDQVGGAQQLALHLPAGAFDAAERQRMILVDHALGHRGGGEGQVVALDRPCAAGPGRASRIAVEPMTAIGRLAVARISPARAIGVARARARPWPA